MITFYNIDYSKYVFGESMIFRYGQKIQTFLDLFKNFTCVFSWRLIYLVSRSLRWFRVCNNSFCYAWSRWPKSDKFHIPVGIITVPSDGDEGSGLTLTDISPCGGVVDFYSSVDIAPITATVGATSDDSLDWRILEPGQQSV